MSLNDILITPAMLSLLYKTALIEIQGNLPSQKKKSAANTPLYLGDNQKKVLIVSHFEDAVHIPDHMLDFLTNILTACKLTIADTAIFNLNNKEEMQIPELISGLQPRIILLFGVGPENLDLPARFPHFQKQILNKITYLACPHLEEIEGDKELKLKLWGSLKNIFPV